MAFFANLYGNAFNQGPVDDATTMRLFPAEVLHAQAIKRAVEADGEVDNLTDFEYVQFAITNRDLPVEDIVQKISLHQTFRKQYGILENPHFAMAALNRYTLQHYGGVLCIQYLPAAGSYVSVMDWAAFTPPKNEEEYRIYFAGMYFIFHTNMPDFEAIRNGLTYVVECEGVGPRNVSHKHMERTAAELYSHYPRKQKEVYFLNSPLVVNIACSLFFRLVGRDLRECFKLGYQVLGWEGRRIDCLYKVPTAEFARMQMLETAREYMERRYRLMTTYRLPPPRN